MQFDKFKKNKAAKVK